MTTDPDEAPAAGPSRRAVEWGVAAILLALTALVVWDNQRIGAGWGSVGPQAGYFPLRIAVAVGLCALAIAWQAWRRPADERFASWDQLKRVMQVMLPLTVYVAAIAWLGIYVSSALFIAGFMMFAGRYPAWKAAALGIATAALMFFVFELQFKVPLPKGPLEAAFGF
jgi:putative tricarboxylic transport membrane protein